MAGTAFSNWKICSYVHASVGHFVQMGLLTNSPPLITVLSPWRRDAAHVYTNKGLHHLQNAAYRFEKITNKYFWKMLIFTLFLGQFPFPSFLSYVQRLVSMVWERWMRWSEVKIKVACLTWYFKMMMFMWFLKFSNSVLNFQFR